MRHSKGKSRSSAAMREAGRLLGCPPSPARTTFKAILLRRVALSGTEKAWLRDVSISSLHRIKFTVAMPEGYVRFNEIICVNYTVLCEPSGVGSEVMLALMELWPAL